MPCLHTKSIRQKKLEMHSVQFNTSTVLSWRSTNADSRIFLRSSCNFDSMLAVLSHRRSGSYWLKMICCSRLKKKTVKSCLESKQGKPPHWCGSPAQSKVTALIQIVEGPYRKTISPLEERAEAWLGISNPGCRYSRFSIVGSNPHGSSESQHLLRRRSSSWRCHRVQPQAGHRDPRTDFQSVAN